MTFADKILAFYESLAITARLPQGVKVLNPYRDQYAWELCKKFYRKYYSDDHQRFIILGINPGRFGAGLTGIPFIDPVKLESLCGIKNDLPMKSELSADFIHRMIASYGGLDKFYNRFYINSVSPLGFIKGDKNMNYYDTPELTRKVAPFIQSSIEKQIDFGIRTDVAVCLGEGENYRYLKKLNDQQNYFGEIVPLAHPRFIMQYRRKHVDQYVADYLKKLCSIDTL